MNDDFSDDMPPLDVATVPTQATLPVVKAEPQPMTPAQARVEAVAHVLHSAYQKASTLELTPEQVKALKADFPDEAFKLGAGGNPELLYIEHAFLRDRLDDVLGMGQWALVRTKPHWAEEFTTQKGQKATRIYADCALLIKGCLVSEAIGEMVYYPNNPTQSYGDAAEGSETAAFRRCAKKIGVGLQAWKKDFCAAWMAKHRGGFKPTPTHTQPIPPKPEPKPTPKCATDATRVWMIEQLKAGPTGANRQIVTEYFQKSGALLPTEEIEDLPLRFVPVSKDELKSLSNCISNFEAGGDLVKAFETHDEGEVEKTAKVKKPIVPIEEDEDAIEPIGGWQGAAHGPESPTEPWRLFPMPWGKHAGTPLEELEKNYLFGLWKNYQVETTYNGKPKKPETIAKDQLFREMLDAAGAFYEFNDPDEDE